MPGGAFLLKGFFNVGILKLRLPAVVWVCMCKDTSQAWALVCAATVLCEYTALSPQYFTHTVINAAAAISIAALTRTVALLHNQHCDGDDESAAHDNCNYDACNFSLLEARAFTPSSAAALLPLEECVKCKWG